MRNRSFISKKDITAKKPEFMQAKDPAAGGIYFSDKRTRAREISKSK